MSKSAENNSSWDLWLVGTGIVATLVPFLTFPTQTVFAQIIPDTTLGNENSLVTPLNPLFEQITGGAIRGSNLFHSFREFNLNEGASVYFVNPTGIENILSRVTGNNPSEIFGKLGVFGDANLFLINPNGIIFGPNAQLDIRGAFVASTAPSFVFGNGTQFSATNPQAPPLLTINVPIGLQYGRQPAAAISNSGNLQVGGDLSLVAGAVNSTGKLSAPTGQVTVTGIDGDVRIQDISAVSAILLANNNLILESSQLRTGADLILLAGNTVWVRDSVANPFVADAGGNLYVQGNQGIDILALNHPGTPFQSGGNLSLVSDGVISGDAHFASGGTFAILNLAGEPGDFVSFYDPIISAEKDVVLGNYTGVSLKVESLGSITTGNIRITGRDPTLQSGTDPDIDILRSSPALILRAGVDKLANPPTSLIPVYNNNFEGEVPSEELSHTSTDVTPKGNRRFLGQFGNDNVSIGLDNLPAHTTATVSFDLFIIRSWDGNDTTWRPDIWNLSIDGGQTLLNTTFSNHNFALGSEPGYPQFQSYPANYDPKNIVNNPARQGAIETPNSLGYEFYLWPISQTKPFDSVYSLSFTFNHSDSNLKLNFSTGSLGGGLDDESWGLDNLDVLVQPTLTSSSGTLSGTNLSVPTPIFSSGISAGNITTGKIATPGGPVILSAAGDIQNGNINTQGGNISLDSGGTINTTAGKLDSYSNQNGGAISLTANGDIILGEITSSGNAFSGQIELNSHTGGISADGNLIIRSDTFGTGRGGDVNITARSFSLTNGATIITGTYQRGHGGNLTINTSDFVEISGTAKDENLTVSRLSTATGGTEPAGDLTIKTGRLIVRDGGVISTSTSGTGQGGRLTINADYIEVSGTALDGFPSGLSTDTISEGNAGDLIIERGRLIVRDGGAVSVSTFGKGRGGNLIVNDAESIELSGASRFGFPSGLYAQAFGAGDAGNLIIRNTESLQVRDGAKVTVAAGNAVDNRIPTGRLELNIPGAPRLSPSPNATGRAGNMEINSNSIYLNNQGQIIGDTESTQGGNITLNVRDLLLLRNNSRISTTAGTAELGGDGGNITINTPFVVGVSAENSDITANAFLGNGGRVTITAEGIYGLEYRLAETDLSDITASSRFGNPGVVTLNIPNFDPSRGLASLPALPGVPETLQICQPGGGKNKASFVNTGQGGMPINPYEPLDGGEILEDLRLPSQLVGSSDSFASPRREIVEATGWIVNERGEVELVAQMPRDGRVYGCGH